MAVRGSKYFARTLPYHRSFQWAACASSSSVLGGREHALAWRLSQSKLVDQIFVAPGNGGTAFANKKSTNVDLPATDFPKLVAFAVENGVTLVIPGPE